MIVALFRIEMLVFFKLIGELRLAKDAHRLRLFHDKALRRNTVPTRDYDYEFTTLGRLKPLSWRTIVFCERTPTLIFVPAAAAIETLVDREPDYCLGYAPDEKSEQERTKGPPIQILGRI